MAVSPESKIHRLSGISISDLNGAAVLQNSATNEYFGLNRVGARIWALIEEPQTVSSIVDLLLEEFSVPRELCESDVLEFVEETTEAHLVGLE